MSFLIFYFFSVWPLGFPGGTGGKDPACQCRTRDRFGFHPWVGKIPWRRKWQPTPVFLPGESQGRGSLVGCRLWGHTQSNTILKDDTVKVLHTICQQIYKTQQWPQDWKRSVFIPIPKKGNAKECSSYRTVALISHASKVMLKILQARLQQYVNHELPDVQAGFRKGRGTTDQIVNIHWII